MSTRVDLGHWWRCSWRSWPSWPSGSWAVEAGASRGRAHIAATTNSLFMAYVGASLPALVFLALVAEPVLLTLKREILALEIVRTLVGSIGIILAMPLSTLIAALMFGTRRRTDQSTPTGSA